MQPEAQPGYYPQQGMHPAQVVATYPQQGQAQVVQGQPGQTIIIQSGYVRQPTSKIYEGYPAKASLVMGWLQIAIGCLLIILNIVAICIDAWLHFVGHGFWCGIWFILTGAFGVWGARSKTLCPIVAFMVLSIMGSLLALVCLSFSAAGAGCDAKDDDIDCRDYWDLPDTSKSARVSVNATMAILAGVECIVAIISSALCCSGVCCGRTSSTGVVISQAAAPQYVTTTTQPTQQMIYYQGAQPAVHQGGATGVPVQQMATASAPPTYSAGPPPAYSSVGEEKQAY